MGSELFYLFSEMSVSPGKDCCLPGPSVFSSKVLICKEQVLVFAVQAGQARSCSAAFYWGTQKAGNCVGLFLPLFKNPASVTGSADVEISHRIVLTWTINPIYCCLARSMRVILWLWKYSRQCRELGLSVVRNPPCLAAFPFTWCLFCSLNNVSKSGKCDTKPSSCSGRSEFDIDDVRFFMSKKLLKFLTEVSTENFLRQIGPVTKTQVFLCWIFLGWCEIKPTCLFLRTKQISPVEMLKLHKRQWKCRWRVCSFSNQPL